jgi:hypothetical protein
MAGGQKMNLKQFFYRIFVCSRKGHDFQFEIGTGQPCGKPLDDENYCSRCRKFQFVEYPVCHCDICEDGD